MPLESPVERVIPYGKRFNTARFVCTEPPLSSSSTHSLFYLLLPLGSWSPITPFSRSLYPSFRSRTPNCRFCHSNRRNLTAADLHFARFKGHPLSSKTCRTPSYLLFSTSYPVCLAPDLAHRFWELFWELGHYLRSFQRAVGLSHILPRSTFVIELEPYPLPSRARCPFQHHLRPAKTAKVVGGRPSTISVGTPTCIATNSFDSR